MTAALRILQFLRRSQSAATARTKRRERMRPIHCVKALTLGSAVLIALLLGTASRPLGGMARVLGPVPVPAAPGNFYLRDGDRVVFYGDSITDQRLYTTFVETYVVTRFPRLKVSFVHSGWGGDRVTGGGGGPIDVRLSRDVIAYKPTVVTIMLGMNDGSYRAFDETIFETYAKGYQHIIDSVKLLLAGYSASCGSRLRAS